MTKHNDNMIAYHWLLLWGCDTVWIIFTLRFIWVAGYWLSGHLYNERVVFQTLSDINSDFWVQNTDNKV